MTMLSSNTGPTHDWMSGRASSTSDDASGTTLTSDNRVP